MTKLDDVKKRRFFHVLRSLLGSGIFLLVMFYVRFWSRPMRMQDHLLEELPVIIVGAVICGVWIFSRSKKQM